MPTDVATLFGRLHASCVRNLTSLIDGLLQTLEQMGADGSFEAFDESVRAALAAFKLATLDELPLRELGLPRAEASRRTMIEGFLFALGMDEDRARSTATRVLSLPASQIQTAPPGRLRTRGRIPDQHMLARDVRVLHGSARDLRERLRDQRTEIARPYRGVPTQRRPRQRGPVRSAARVAEDGVEQVADLLGLFPELSTKVYRDAGFSGLENYPPQAVAPLGPDVETIRVELIENYEEEQRWSIFGAIGLAAAGILLTIATGGAFGVLAATAVGTSFGLATGGANVYNAQTRLTATQDAQRFGAASAERVDFLEGELQGAWGMLAADVVTGGVIGRTATTSVRVGRILNTVRIAAISGGGTAMGTATNPNVWAAPDTAGILLQATVIGAVAGGVPAGLAGAASSLRNGSRVMVGVRSADDLRPGGTVRLAGQTDGAPFDARIVAVGRDGTIVVETPSGRRTLRVQNGAVLRANSARVGHASETQGALSNLGDSAISNTANTLGDYGTGATFSGVYNPPSGKMLCMPSGDTRTTGGAMPGNLVPRRGGHYAIEQVLNPMVQGSRGQNIGFTAFLQGDGTIVMEFFSRGVNGANNSFPGYIPPEAVQREIADVMRDATQRTVTIRQR